MTKKFRILFYLSIPLLIAHSLEEYLTDFYNFNPVLMRGMQSIVENPILTFLVMLWLVLIVIAIMITNQRWRLYLAVFPGLLFTFELHHWVEFFIDWRYAAGEVTAAIFPVFLYFFWKEWLINFNKRH